MTEKQDDLKFTITEGEHKDYWANYDEFIQLYNNNKLKVSEIREKLDLSQSRYKRYREKALEEDKLTIDKRNPRINKTKKHDKNKLNNVTRLQDKIYKYIEFTWYDIHCKDKKDVQKIIAREILKHPEMDFDEIYLHCKRKCMAEL